MDLIVAFSADHRAKHVDFILGFYEHRRFPIFLGLVHLLKNLLGRNGGATVGYESFVIGFVRIGEGLADVREVLELVGFHFG